ncbi:hypothetical protein SUGI_0328190 [Cryptomeria japonica]|nr:hypothetical protein SUGI_0328190 [Cryptomeria japonica]
MGEGIKYLACPIGIPRLRFEFVFLCLRLRLRDLFSPELRGIRRPSVGLERDANCVDCPCKRCGINADCGINHRKAVRTTANYGLNAEKVSNGEENSVFIL